MLLLFLMHSFLINRNTMLTSWESEKHGIICVGKDLWRSVSLTSCLGQAYIRLLRSLTSLAMIISDYEDSQPLDTLLQCLTTLVVQKVLPYSQSGFPRPNLCPLSLTFQIQEESNQIAEEAEILSFILLFFQLDKSVSYNFSLYLCAPTPDADGLPQASLQKVFLALWSARPGAIPQVWSQKCQMAIISLGILVTLAHTSQDTPDFLCRCFFD